MHQPIHVPPPFSGSIPRSMERTSHRAITPVTPAMATRKLARPLDNNSLSDSPVTTGTHLCVYAANGISTGQIASSSSSLVQPMDSNLSLDALPAVSCVMPWSRERSVLHLALGDSQDGAARGQPGLGTAQCCRKFGGGQVDSCEW